MYDVMEFLGAGIVLGTSAGISPGPLLALVLSHTVRHGVGEGIKVAAAPLVTDLPIILVSTFILSRFTGYRGLLGLISLTGAGVLAWMAWETFQAKRQDPEEDSVPALRSLMKGATVNALSPHPYLFWLTVGAPMILKGWTRTPAAGILFVVGFTGSLVGSKVIVAVLTGRSARSLDGKGYTLLMRVFGMLLLLFAILLAVDGLRALLPRI